MCKYIVIFYYNMACLLGIEIYTLQIESTNSQIPQHGKSSECFPAKNLNGIEAEVTATKPAIK